MKFKNIFFIFLFLATLFINGFFKTYRLTQLPPALFSDEVDAGYQAFVFNNCFSDYFGNKFPTHFHSFSDWRTSLYIYSTSLVQKFTGANELSVRLPSVIFGFISPLVFYFIIKKLLNNKWWALLSIFFFSISPWIVHYSRTGFEVSGMILVLLLGILYWLKYLDSKKNLHLILSALFFISSIYFYSTAKLFLVFVALSMILVWSKEIFSIKNKTKIFLLIIIFILPFIVDSLRGRAGFRFSYINIFGNPVIPTTNSYLRYEDAILNHYGEIGLQTSLLSKISHNYLTEVSSKFITNYFSSFSTDFLFLKGDSNLRQGFGQRGYLLYPDLIFVLIGITSSFQFLLKPKSKRTLLIKFSEFMILWLFFAPIPFALTRDSNSAHGTRLIIMSIPLLFFSFSGIYYIFEHFNKIKPLLSKIFLTLTLGLYLFCFFDFYHFYTYHYPQNSARDWHTGMKETIIFSESLPPSTKIYFSNEHESFIPFFLFYKKYLPTHNTCSPAKNLIWDNNDFFTGMQTEQKYYFGHLEWNKLARDRNNITGSIFVIPKDEKERMENGIRDYNQSNGKDIKITLINKTSTKYLNQEEFYFVSLN
ncbi:MAG: glycosyltransferase family 39 protein [Candidatus Shapirobacteria bacterium]|nr:glycosyltransferase family 39 protein [Candidatus Shapirobacteria bacterium]